MENVRKERLAAGKPAEEKEDEDPGDGEGTEDDLVPVSPVKPAVDPAAAADKGKAAETNGKEEVEVKEEEEDGVPLRKKFGFDDLAQLAEAEIERRKTAAGGPAEDLTLRPWSFPRGGFRHQVMDDVRNERS